MLAQEELNKINKDLVKTFNDLTVITIWNDEEYKMHLNMLNSLPSGIEIVSIHCIPSDSSMVHLNGIQNIEDRILENKSRMITADWLYYKREGDFIGDFNFRDPQNEAIKLATNSWILKLDSDEEITITQDKLDFLSGRLFNKPEIGVGGYRLPIISYQISSDTPYPWYRVDSGSIRLFRNIEGIEYNWMVHEQPTEKLIQLGYKVSNLPITITHSGYMGEASVIDKKLKRNYTLILRQMEEKPHLKYDNALVQYLYKELDLMKKFGLIKLIEEDPNKRFIEETKQNDRTS